MSLKRLHSVRRLHKVKSDRSFLDNSNGDNRVADNSGRRSLIFALRSGDSETSIFSTSPLTTSAFLHTTITSLTAVAASYILTDCQSLLDGEMTRRLATPPPQKNFIADAVRDRMARTKKAAPVKAPSTSPPTAPQQSTKTKRKRDEINQKNLTIDLTESDHEKEDASAALAPKQEARRLISPQSPLEEAPRTPEQESPRSPVKAPRSPSKMPSLLQSALSAATSPKRPVESPQSPVEEINSRKRKLETSPTLAQEPPTKQESPRSPIEETTSRKRKCNTSSSSAQEPPSKQESPRSPVEETATRSTPAASRAGVASQHTPDGEPPEHVVRMYASVESPTSPVEETAPAHASITSPSSPIEETASPTQSRSTTNVNAAESTTTTTQPAPHGLQTTQTSSRYAPSSYDGIEYRNPAKFSLKPPFWQRWSSKDYINFAEHLRYQLDPVPFAKQTGIPVEEILHVFNAVVCNPLYEFKEAKKRGEEGMREVMEIYQSRKYATPRRPWGREEHEFVGAEPKEKRWLGELKGVREGAVELVLASSGNEMVMWAWQLGEKDIKYLRETLGEEDYDKVWVFGV